MAMKGIWKNMGKYARFSLKKRCLGEDQVECHFVEFPQGKIILGVLEMRGKTQVGTCHNYQTSPENGKNCQKAMKTKHSPFLRSLDGNEGNMEVRTLSRRGPG